MLPLIVFLILAMVALGVIGALIKGMMLLTIIAAIFLALTVAIGLWTLARRRSRV